MKFRAQDYKENLLRSCFILLLLGLILGFSMDKILKLLNLRNADILVSLSIQPLVLFPVWPSFVCGQGLTNVIARSIKRGKGGVEEQRDLPSSFIKPVSTSDLAPGDWTDGNGVWPCFVFNTNKTLNFVPGDIDQVVLVASSDQLPANNQNQNQNGLLYGIFDEVRNLSTVEPFVGPIPSRNSFTFTRNRRIDVNNKTSSYFFVNKQNIISEPTPFRNFDPNVVATFAYSPDTYLVMTYTEKKPNLVYELVTGIGGLITYALPAWFIMFGRGKYRSWGLIQRYLLRNSPDATKNDNSNRLFPVYNDKSRDVESQTHLVVTPPPGNDDKSYRPTSLFYFNSNQPNFNPAVSPNLNLSPNHTLSPNLTSPSNPLQEKEINKLIDAKINQKLWFVEQTLSRHYLAGFRLRRYDVDPSKLGTPYDEVDDTLTPPTVNRGWQNLDSGISHRDSGNVPNVPNFPPPPTQNLSHQNSHQSFQNNNGSINSFNPEEQRSQYPNVAIGQIPFEKKKGSGNLPTSGNDTISTAHDGNYFSNVSVQMPPSSYSSNVPIQLPHSNNSNINSSPLSQSQTPFPQGGYMSFSNSQEQNQGSLRGPEERW